MNMKKFNKYDIMSSVVSLFAGIYISHNLGYFSKEYIIIGVCLFLSWLFGYRSARERFKKNNKITKEEVILSPVEETKEIKLNNPLEVLFKSKLVGKSN